MIRCINLFVLCVFWALPVYGQQSLPPAVADREEVFETPQGKQIMIKYHLPDHFDQQASYPVMITPGNFFLKNDPALHGWVMIEAFFGKTGFNNDDIRSVINHLHELIDVRNDKLHMMSYSANSGVMFRVAAAFPNDFAGLLTIPGHPRNRGQFEKLKDMRIRFIVGERDSYWLKEAQKAHDTFKNMGTDTELEIVDNGGHVLEKLAGKPLYDRINRWFP
ncbi:alpha/beta hydrolase family protein [Kordiimonas aquimaris]|uniref:alpha/beta hydrolase family protein n=1 Tax=Kordiimonas aquimaris TaxID=707591 RepID=UPI0021D2291F|nr:hypothetical protein [Kordiimonas aquimaris]